MLLFKPYNDCKKPLKGIICYFTCVTALELEMVFFRSSLICGIVRYVWGILHFELWETCFSFLPSLFLSSPIMLKLFR